MLNKIVEYAPYVMALLIGMIANRVIDTIQLFTHNVIASNIIGLLFGFVTLFIWKYLYWKLIIKKNNDSLDQFR